MNNTYMKTGFLVCLAVALLAFVAACAQTASMAAKHPVELTERPLCRDCHTDWRSSLDHTQDFYARHRYYAAQRREVCELCHAASFCAECHANKSEIKPSDLHKDEPDRTMPHPGDYLTQHQIDGRINPASCFPCHGRQNNARCKVCHV